MIGMAVGIDYSLFYLRREREERMNGHGDQAAVGIAAATSGRAILVSGLTVMVSLAGLFLTGIDIFTGIAFGTIMVVGVAVLGSLFSCRPCSRGSARGPTGSSCPTWAAG